MLNPVQKALNYVRGQHIPQIELTTMVNEHLLLAGSTGLCLYRKPQALIIGTIAATYFQAIASGTIQSGYKPLAEKTLEVIEPLVTNPATVADMVALTALMLFDDFATLTAVFVGLNLGFIGRDYTH